jgi:YesN/AraC family two-component response regulator
MATGKMTTSKHLQLALDAGAMDYVRKPIDKIELLARARSAIMLHNEMQKSIQLEKAIAEKKQKELQNELEQNQRELNHAIIRLTHDSQFRMNILHKIAQLKKECPTGIENKIVGLENQIKTEYSATNWDEFDILFRKVHGNFMANLHQKHSHLSPNERKLCVYLKLNMSSKDISSITFQSTEALKKARFRLRKKMNLPSHEDLSTYLQQF